MSISRYPFWRVIRICISLDVLAYFFSYSSLFSFPFVSGWVRCWGMVVFGDLVVLRCVSRSHYTWHLCLLATINSTANREFRSSRSAYGTNNNSLSINATFKYLSLGTVWLLNSVPSSLREPLFIIHASGFFFAPATFCIFKFSSLAVLCGSLSAILIYRSRSTFS